MSIDNPYYWELVWRNNAQIAYGAGRAFEVMRSNPPYLEFVTSGDERECPICHQYNGVVRPATDPFWELHWTLLHHGCRCPGPWPISREEYDARRQTNPHWGVTPEHMLPREPLPAGFGANPLATGHWWRPEQWMVDRAKEYGLEVEFELVAKKVLPDWAYARVFQPNGQFSEIGTCQKAAELDRNLLTAEILSDAGYNVRLLNARKEQ